MTVPGEVSPLAGTRVRLGIGPVLEQGHLLRCEERVEELAVVLVLGRVDLQRDERAHLADVDRVDAGPLSARRVHRPPVLEDEEDKEPSDEELLKMKPQDMTHAQLQRAFALKSAQ